MRLITCITALLLAGVVGYFVYCGFVRKEMGPEYPFVMAGFLTLLWLNSNVLSIIITDGFEGKDEEQIRSYKIFCLLELVGLVGVGVFLIGGENMAMYGAVVYAMCAMYKRKYLKVYKDGVEDEETDEEDEEADDVDGTVIVEDEESGENIGAEASDTENRDRNETDMLTAEAAPDRLVEDIQESSAEENGTVV